MEPYTRDQLNPLHPVNHYEGFDASKYQLKVHGWEYNDPIFARLAETVPFTQLLIIEVGTWLGASAFRMANMTPDCVKIMCVDTWLGALEFYANPDDATRFGQLGLVSGYPTVYYQFLANVVHQNLQHRIIPFPNTSLIAARWCRQGKVQADLVYIDASHDYEDVVADVEAWLPVVRKGGVLFGDDYLTFLDVNRAVNDVAKRRGLHVFEFGNKWQINC